MSAPDVYSSFHQLDHGCDDAGHTLPSRRGGDCVPIRAGLSGVVDGPSACGATLRASRPTRPAVVTAQRGDRRCDVNDLLHIVGPNNLLTRLEGQQLHERALTASVAASGDIFATLTAHTRHTLGLLHG